MRARVPINPPKMSVSGTPALTLGDYLERLQGTTFRRLYQQPSTAFAIFRRMLTHLGERVTTCERERERERERGWGEEEEGLSQIWSNG